MRLLLLSLLMVASPAAAAEEVPFVPSGASFADAGACRSHLLSLVDAADRRDFAAVRGPYEIGAGDVRAHMVRADESGHSITEHRCLAEKLSSRTWRHSMDGSEEEGSETIEAMAAKAEWLKKPVR